MKPLFGIMLLASTLWLNSCPPKPPEPNQVLSKYSWGKVILHPKPHDILMWTDVQVQFSKDPNLNPCKGDPKDPVVRCEIDVTSGTYRYDCDPSQPCPDPEVEVGTETAPPLESKSGAPPKSAAGGADTTRVNKRVYISCANNSFTLSPSTIEATAGSDNVVFLTEGDPNVGNTPTDWKIKLSTANGCSGQTDFDSAHPQCVLDATVGTMLAYTATTAKCPTGTGSTTTGHIKVN
jgi:hypothetical protein